MIRKAEPSEASTLTAIAFASKRYWDYPEEYLVKWKDELTITESYITANAVFVYEKQSRAVAFYSLIHRNHDSEFQGDLIPRGLWLDHMFVLPDKIGAGIGTELFKSMLDYTENLKGQSIFLFADPHARGFYLKMGCDLIREFPSSIQGRTTPLMQIKIIK